MRNRILTTTCLALALSACGGPPELETVPASYAPHVIEHGDTVRVTVLGHESLSGEHVVSETGTIQIPLIGSIVAGGETGASLDEAIEAALRDKGYLVAPYVSLDVIAEAPVYVLGQVAQPGEYDWRSQMTVRQALAIAGGATYRATEHVTLTRDGETWRADRSALVQPGDVIEVDERYW